MKRFLTLTKRNIKVYFSDKSMFFVSLITPLILLVLYASFLGGIFRDSFLSAIPEGLNVSNKIINSLVSGQILSSLLAVSCVTVAFTSNLLMVTDKANGRAKDINITPISKGMISLSYFVASFVSTIIVNTVALILCLGYTYIQGWFYSIGDIFILFGDVILLTLFGCALSSVINFNLKSQGQVSAIGTIVSAGYGFVCGAYMPISNFSSGLQKALSYLPGTYGTSLVKNHMLNGVYKEMADTGLPSEAVTVIRNTLDCNPVFRGHVVGVSQMYLIMAGSIVVFGAAYLLIIMIRER